MLCLIFCSLIFFTPSKETELIFALVAVCTCVEKFSLSFMYVQSVLPNSPPVGIGCQGGLLEKMDYYRT